MHELCTQHAVTAHLGAQKWCKYGEKCRNCTHSTGLPRSWEPKSSANMVRNARTADTARGYRVVGSAKMLQIWREMHELRTHLAVTAWLGAQKWRKYGKKCTNCAHSARLPRSWEPKKTTKGKKCTNCAHSTQLPRSWENGANMVRNA
jgi:hypothetical protein